MEPTRGVRPAPELAYVLATDEVATVRGVLAALGRQTRADAIELVLVAPGELDTRAVPANLGGLRVERCPSPIALPVARALGIRAATAPLVFVGETHSFPEPEMVERLLAAFAEGWDGVVPAIVNANPGSARSWAGFLLDYGRWGARRPAAAISDPLVYNAAYRRDALLALGEGLADAISSTDTDLQRAFHAAGRRVHFEPAARIRHLNVSRLGAFLRERFCCGLLLGRFRARRWPWHRRLLYAAAAPLVPVVLFVRSRRAIAAALAAERPPRATAIWIAVALVTRAAGEALGYLGAGAGSERVETEIEIHRGRYVTEAP
jgi:hypothetical protein